MKRIVKVTIEKEYEISIPESSLTHDEIEAFEQSFWELDADDYEGKVNKLFEAAAYQLANGEEYFVEGIGPCSSVFTANLRDKSPVVVYELLDEFTETEIVE